MLKSDVFGAVLIVGVISLFAWLIYRALRSGQWRYRGGIAYRETTPKLYWGIIMTACIVVAALVFAVLMMLNHRFLCDGRGTPGECLAQLLR